MREDCALRYSRAYAHGTGIGPRERRRIQRDHRDVATKRTMTRTVGRNRAAGGRDWVVGDVHGCFRTLRHALLAIDFEYRRDRLFSVGDLIDRGPNSIEALTWLEGERFEAVVMGNHEAEMIRLLQTGEVLAPAKPYQQWMWNIERQGLFRWYRALRPLPLAVTVETAQGQVGIVHCSTWQDSWSATLDALEKRDIVAINMVLLGIDEQEKRAGPTGNRVTGIDRVIAGHDARKQIEKRENMWSIDTGAGFPAMNRLSLARIDVDPPEIETFDVIDD